MRRQLKARAEPLPEAHAPAVESSLTAQPPRRRPLLAPHRLHQPHLEPLEERGLLHHQEAHPAIGRLSVHCRCATLGSTASRCAPVSSARRVVHDGHQPRPLHEKATRREAWQSAQLTSTKPHRTSPQPR